MGPQPHRDFLLAVATRGSGAGTERVRRGRLELIESAAPNLTTRTGSKPVNNAWSVRSTTPGNARQETPRGARQGRTRPVARMQARSHRGWSSRPYRP